MAPAEVLFQGLCVPLLTLGDCLTIACTEPYCALAPSDPQLRRRSPFPTFPQPKPPSLCKHATGPHSAAARESREPRGRGVGSGMYESCAPLPKRKPTIKRPAASTSVPMHSQRGRRQATKVESASCRGFHISARPAGPPRTCAASWDLRGLLAPAPPPGTCASAVDPLQRGSGTVASSHPHRAYQLLRARRRGAWRWAEFLRPRIVLAHSEPISFGRFYQVQTLIIQHPEAVRLWLVYFFACVCTTIKTFLKKIKA